MQDKASIINRLKSSFVYLSVLSLLVQSAPFFISPARATESVGDQSKLDQATYLNGAVEKPEKRTAHSKSFETSDGKGWAEVHQETINYQDGQGNWQPVNNNLATISDPNYAYGNTANRYAAHFKSTLASDFFALQQGSDQISFSLQGGSSVQGTISGTTIIYPNALAGIDFVYSTDSDSVKSQLVLNSEPTSRIVNYQATLSSGLQLSTDSFGNIKVTNGSGTTIWTLPKPSTIQPITHEPIFTNYSSTSLGSNQYQIGFTIPDNFLPVPEKGYPVVIDPSIVLVDSSNTASNYVLQGDPTITYKSSSNNNTIPVGHTTLDEARAFMKFDTSSIPANSSIDSSVFSITMQEERASIPRIKLYSVTQDWNQDDLNWNNQPSVASTFEDSYANDVTYSWWNFDVTNLTKGWYSGSTPNYGFSLRGHDPGVSRRYFFSKYYSSDPNRKFNPYVLIYYHPNSGQGPTPPQMLGTKPWWQTVNSPLAVGNASVNVANGNLAFNFNDVSVQDQGLDVSVSHTYNSQDTYNDKFGYGWTTSANKRLVPSQDRKTVLYVDETGTSFTFRDDDGNGNYLDTPYDASSGFYKQTDHRPNGLTWGLKYDSGADHYIAKSSSNMTYTFDGSGKILEEKDKNANKVTYQYTSGKLTGVVGNSGKTVSLAYDSNGMLASVKDYNDGDSQYSGNGGIVSYLYDNGDLKTLKFQQEGQSNPFATLTFNYTNHRLDSIVDALNNTTSFTYDGSKRVTDIYDAENKHTKIDYTSAGLTKVTTPKYFVDGGDQEKYMTDYYYRTNPYYQTGLVYRQISPKLTNNQNQTVRNITEYDYNDDYQLHATTDPIGAVDASAYDDVSGFLFYQYDENHTLTLEKSYTLSNYDQGDWRLVDSYDGNGTQTSYQYDTNGNVIYKGILDGNINLIHNPGYESNVRDPNVFDPNCSYVKQGLADFWCGTGTGSNNRIYGVDTGTFNDGSKSQYVGFNNNTSSGSVNAFQTINEATRPLPDTDYVLTWNYKNDISSNFYVQIAIIHYDTWGNQIGSTILDSNHYSSSAWDQKSFSFHTPATNSSTGYPYWTSDIFMRAKSDTTGTNAKAWFDSVSLERGTTSSTRTEKAITFTYTDALHSTPTGLPLTETTPEGKTAHYDWDSRGNMLKTTDALNKSTTFTYDANGNKLTKVEPNGNDTLLDPDDYKYAYVYDTRGRIILVKEVKTNNQTTYQYDANGNLIQTTTPNGLITKYTYDKVNRAKTIINPYDYSSNVEYDAQGNPKGIVDPNSNASSVAYDGADRIVQETNPGGQATNYSYDDNNNLKKTDENGKTLQYNYDSTGKLTSETNNQLGSDKTIQYQYDNAGNLTVINNQTGETVNHTYSATGEVTKVTIGAQTTIYTRNKNNQVTKIEKSNGDITEYSYNDDAQFAHIKNSRNNTPYLEYDYGYDANGNRTRITTVTNGNSSETGYQYDNINQLTQSAVVGGLTTNYTYDNAGNITHVAISTGSWTNYTYDGNRLIKKTTSAGSTEYIGYDASGNLTSRDTADKVDFLSHFNNNLINARDNQAGKIENSTQGYTPVYETGKFNQALQLNSQTYISFSSSSNINPNTGTVEMWVKPHWNNGSSTRVFFDYYVDTNSIIRLQKTSTNKLQLFYIRSGANYTATSNSSVTWTNGTWMHLAATWNSTTAKLYVNGQNLSSTNSTYFCDPNLPCDPPWGGRSPKIGFGATTETNPSNYADVSLDEARLSSYVRTSSEISSSYNATSEFTLPHTTTYEYDSHDYLTKITKPDGTVFGYTYDANKRLTKRTKTSASDINYQYDGDKLTQETNNDGSIINKYYYDSQGEILKVTHGSSDYFLTRDGLGGSISLRDGNGNSASSYVYDDWGKLVSKTEQFSMPVRYASYWYDDDAGLYHMGARWYDPSIYRFLSEDPDPGDQNDSITQNEYVYARNNPIRYTDPNGKFAWAFTLAANPEVTAFVLLAYAVILLANNSGIKNRIAGQLGHIQEHLGKIRDKAGQVTRNTIRAWKKEIEVAERRIRELQRQLNKNKKPGKPWKKKGR